MKIGDIKRQIVFDSETKEGIHYLLTSGDREVHLSDILDALKSHFSRMPLADKNMLRDLCLMLSNGKAENYSEPESRKSVLRFIMGFLIGRYFVNTNTLVTSEKIIVNRSISDES